jgi:hypothetical protein
MSISTAEVVIKTCRISTSDLQSNIVTVPIFIFTILAQITMQQLSCPCTPFECLLKGYEHKVYVPSI